MEKKLSELTIRDIAKYLLVAEELNWVDANIGDSILVAQYMDGELTYRKLTVTGDTQ